MRPSPSHDAGFQHNTLRQRQRRTFRPQPRCQLASSCALAVSETISSRGSGTPSALHLRRSKQRARGQGHQQMWQRLLPRHHDACTSVMPSCCRSLSRRCHVEKMQLLSTWAEDGVHTRCLKPIRRDTQPPSQQAREPGLTCFRARRGRRCPG
jgi:hypothetical protein